MGSMEYIDTNVLVRIITGDDEKLAEQAITEIQGGSQNEFAVLDAVLVELWFVLEFHDYKMSRLDIAEALEALTSAPQIFITENTQEARTYKPHLKLDYADCSLLIIGDKDGVFTFDKDLRESLP